MNDDQPTGISYCFFENEREVVLMGVQPRFALYLFGYPSTSLRVIAKKDAAPSDSYRIEFNLKGIFLNY
jgi:hypothetical protein